MTEETVITDRVEEKRQHRVSFGRDLVTSGKVIFIQNGAVLDTIPEFTDKEYELIYEAIHLHCENYPRGTRSTSKIQVPAWEIRLPEKYPEYLVFVRWDDSEV